MSTLRWATSLGPAPETRRRDDLTGLSDDEQVLVAGRQALDGLVAVAQWEIFLRGVAQPRGSQNLGDRQQCTQGRDISDPVKS